MAKVNLGMCYFLGQGVPQDKQKGYDLIKQAAEQGDSQAMKQLEIIKTYM